MIIQIIDLEGVALLETENHAPIPRDLHRIKAVQLSFEHVQAPTGRIELLGPIGRIERSQDTGESLNMVLLDPTRIALFKEPF